MGGTTSGVRVNYPNRTQSANVTAEFTPDIEKKIKRFVVSDDLRDWRSIPKKLYDFGHSTKSAVLVPYCPYATGQNKNFEPFRRQLYINTENPVGGSARGQKKPIPISRPSGHDAYIHSISFQAFDFNEPLPSVDVDAIVSDLQTVDPTASEGDMLINNAFTGQVNEAEHDIPGIMIATVNTSSPTALDDWIRSSNYTTADYPDMSYTRATANHMKLLEDLHKVNERLSEAAPRSNALRGALPTDWAMNYFNVAVGGFDNGGSVFTDESDFPLSPDSYIYDSRGRINTTDDPDAMTHGEWDMDEAAGAERGIGSDYPLPIINNDLNIKIPSSMDYLTVEIGGPGWFHWLDVVGYSNSVKGTLATDKPYRTLVRMPVRVVVDILYYPQG